MFQFPNINPIAVDFGFIKISWYALSYIAGILLFGLIFKKLSLNCSFLIILIGKTLYLTFNSSKRIEIFLPLGVDHVYKSIT